MGEKLLTIKEVARFLKRNERDIEQLVASGNLPGYRIGGEFLRFRKDQVEAIKRGVPIEKIPLNTGPETETSEPPSTSDIIKDFFYFNDFYIVSALVIVSCVLVIYKLLQ